jgi:trimeric autotransporter adhesin
MRKCLLALVMSISTIGFSQGIDSLWKSIKDNNLSNGRTVYAIASTGSHIIVGGSFNNFGTAGSKPYIAEWDGTQWMSVASDIINADVRVLHVDEKNQVYIGGDFYTGTNSKANYFGRYSSGGGVGPLKPNINFSDSIDGPVYAITSDTNFVYIGGNLQHVGYLSTMYAAAFDRHTHKWKTMSPSPGGAVLGMVKGTDSIVYACGKFGVKKWNGTAWSSVGLNNFNGFVTCIAYKNGQLYAGNDQMKLMDGTTINYIAHLNTGSNKWEALGTGVDGTQIYKHVTSLSFRGNDLIVGGYFESAGGVANTKGIARWDGTKWYAVDNGVQYTEWGSYLAVDAIHVMQNGEMFIGGCFTSAGNKADTRNAAKIGIKMIENFGTDLSNTYSMLLDGNDAYLGSTCTYPDGKEYKTFLKWNEQSGFKAMGQGLTGNIFALAKDNNYIYAAGEFTGMVTKGLARWDGSKWIGWGTSTGMDIGMRINSIALIANKAYVGGNFDKIDGKVASKIAVWDDNAWQNMSNGANGDVRALSVYKGQLVVGGLFSSVGAAVPNTWGVAIWDGANWKSVNNGIAAGEVDAVACSDSLIIIGGGFNNINGAKIYKNLAWWNESVWGKPAVPIYGNVIDLAYKNKYLYVVSYVADTFKLQRIYLPAPSNTETLVSGLTADNNIKLSVTDSAVYVCGRDIQNFFNGYAFKNFFRYNLYGRDNGWESLAPKTVGGAINSISSGNKKLYVGGEFYNLNSMSLFNVAKWNTFFWEPMNNPSDLTGTIYSSSAVGNEVYYGGDFTNPNGGKNVIKWNGLMWDNLGGGLQYPVSVVAAKNNNEAYAGIPFVYSGILSDFKSVFKWDGSVWTPLEGADMMPIYPLELDKDPIQINAIAFMENKMFVGGRYASVGTIPGTANICQYDGTKWTALMNGVDSAVYALAVKDSLLYVGGNFKDINGMSNTHYLACWNGKKWTPLFTGIDGPVYSLCFIGSNLYIGGDFTKAGNVSVNNIAVWDGKNFSALGSGVDRPVNSLTTDGNSLFVSGYFNKAGRKDIPQLALWNGIKPYVVSQMKDTTVKLGTAVTLTATINGSMPMAYQWYKDSKPLTGQTNAVIMIDSFKYINVGKYYLMATNAVGSVNTATFEVKPGLPSPQICMVTVDTALKCNKIIWEKNESYPIQKYKIYQEIGKDLYVPIGEKLYGELSIFNDTFADPSKQSYSYKITAVDSTGKYESNISECISHRTMHVVIVDKQGSSGTYLQWNSYDGFSFPSYTIYRKTGIKFDSLSTTAAGYFYNSFLDNYFSTTATCYLIKVNSPKICAPTGTFKAESGPYTQSLSNIAEYKAVGLASANEIPVSVYPNPFSENLTIEFSLDKSSDVLIEVANATGQKTAEFSYKDLVAGTQQIQLSAAAMNIAEGMCYVKIMATEKTSVIKVNHIK